MFEMKPTQAPDCWSFKYQDGDQECNQCAFRDKCKSTLLSRIASQPVPHSPPRAPFPSQPFLPAPPSHMTGPVYRPPAPSPLPIYRPPVHVTQPQPVMQQYQQPPVMQQYQGVQGSLPDFRNPNPLMAMQRPGAQGPAYYFTQYPGESVTSRLSKNMTLRGAEAIFGELTSFFRHWTWPPNS